MSQKNLDSSLGLWLSELRAFKTKRLAAILQKQLSNPEIIIRAPAATFGRKTATKENVEALKMALPISQNDKTHNTRSLQFFRLSQVEKKSVVAKNCFWRAEFSCRRHAAQW